MPRTVTAATIHRIIPYVCLIVFVLLVIVWNFPISDSVTRIDTIVLAVAAWLLFLATIWRWRVTRYAIIAITFGAAVFLALPTKRMPPAVVLRSAYVAALQRYVGTRYVWGGESWTGIDCSGLIRRAMIDALVATGVRTLSPEAVRQGIHLWWHDSTAADLALGTDGTTISLRLIPAIRQEPPAALLPGDLAGTKSGIHILAYLGDGRWIDADPSAERVRISTLDAKDNGWFDDPMRIARWRDLLD